MSAGVALVVRATVRVPIFDSRSGASAPWLASSVPALWLVLGAVVLFGAVGAALARKRWEDRLTPFLPGGLAAAVLLPGVFAEAPFLASFAGRFLDLLLVAGAAISISRLAPRIFSIAASARAVGVGGFLLYLAVGFWISERVGLSGDEPHYLLVSYSLLDDFDLKVQNNYGEEDYRSFYQGKIEPRLAVGTPYPVHGIGVPILLAPGFAAFGLRGVVATEALMAALLLSVLYRASFRLTGSASASLAAAAGFGLTSPALFLSVSAYPELPAALLAAFAALRLADSEPPRPTAAFGLALALGALPFLHVKFLPLGGLLLAASAYAIGRRRASSLAGLACGAAVSLGSFLLFTYLTLGSLDPTASYGRQRIFLERVPLGLAGLLFDQEYGLLLHAPIYLLGFAGIVTLFRRSPPLGWVSLLAFLSVAVPGAAHPLWSGGTSPPARFLFPALPLLAIGAAALLAREREIGVGPWAPWLLASSAAVSFSMVFLPGGPFFLNARGGTGRIWEALSSSWNLTDYLPSLVRGDPRSLASASALSLLVLLAAIAQIARARGFRIAALAVGLLLAAWLQDRTGVSRSRELEPQWVSRLMHELSRRGEERYVSLPSFERLSTEALAARAPLPLEAFSGDGDPRHWWSRAYSLPAGRFRLSGAPLVGITFTNGESAFLSDEPAFLTRVGLGRFRLRARSLFEPPKLFLVEPRPSSIVALKTLSRDGLRFHALDDEADPDPEGFWVRKGSRASFALEAETPGLREASIRIANGGVPNVASVDAGPLRERFRLEPWEEREIPLPLDAEVRTFSVESESGFRPSELDPASRDRRELGVLVRARPAFD